MFQNETKICVGNNCTYSGTDKNGYTICDCYIENKKEVFSNSTKEILLKFPHWNIDIVYCYNEFLEDVKINKKNNKKNKNKKIKLKE
jgi:hypothetical protein